MSLMIYGLKAKRPFLYFYTLTDLKTKWENYKSNLIAVIVLEKNSYRTSASQIVHELIYGRKGASWRHK